MTVVLHINFSGWQYLLDVLIIQTYNFPELNVNKNERPFSQACLNWLKFWLLVLLSLIVLRVQTWGSLQFGKIPLRFFWKYSEFFGTGSICANIWVLSYVIATQTPSPTSQKNRILKWENLGIFPSVFCGFWLLALDLQWNHVISALVWFTVCTGLTWAGCQGLTKPFFPSHSISRKGGENLMKNCGPR